MTNQTRRFDKCLIIFAVFCGSLAVSAQSTAVGSAAQATQTPLERLLIEDEIRQKITLYGLYADGDGAGGKPRDLRTLADTLLTPDVISEIHRATGGAPTILKGREVVANSRPEIDSDRARMIAGRHYVLNTVFDEITATHAVTRTPAVYFDATRNVVGADCAAAGYDGCGGRPIRTVMWVYEMHWRKTPDGWQIERNVLRDDN